MLYHANFEILSRTRIFWMCYNIVIILFWYYYFAWTNVMILIQHDNIYESSKIPKPKGVIRSQKLKKDRQYYKNTNNGESLTKHYRKKLSRRDLCNFTIQISLLSMHIKDGQELLCWQTYAKMKTEAKTHSFFFLLTDLTYIVKFQKIWRNQH